MANEPRVPEVRDDDVEEVADKLSIASAMWSRGDRADALTWLRRAAESASDAEHDMRALELAKAASELAALDAPQPAPVSQPAPEPAPAPTSSAAPPRPKTAPPPKPAAAPGRAPAAAASTLPKKAPPGSRPPGSKLPPLPPMRPLGTPAPAPAKAPRLPSMITSATGTTTASGTVHRDDTPAPPEPSKPMPWDEAIPEEDDEPTSQITLAQHENRDLEETRVIAAMASQPVREEPAEEPPATTVARELTLAVGVRVRIVAAADGVHVVPEGETTEGVAAVLVPLDANDDLRTVFQRRA